MLNISNSNTTFDDLTNQVKVNYAQSWIEPKKKDTDSEMNKSSKRKDLYLREHLWAKDPLGDRIHQDKDETQTGTEK